MYLPVMFFSPFDEDSISRTSLLFTLWSFFLAWNKMDFGSEVVMTYTMSNIDSKPKSRNFITKKHKIPLSRVNHQLLVGLLHFCVNLFWTCSPYKHHCVCWAKPQVIHLLKSEVKFLRVAGLPKSEWTGWWWHDFWYPFCSKYPVRLGV